MENILHKTRTYLVGHIQYASGRDWRGHVEEELAPLGIQIFNPEEPLPFKDEEFDITLSLGYFSTVYSPLAKKFAEEVLRVTRSSIYHLEDSRGPEISLKLIQYSLKTLYDELGRESTTLPVLQEEKQTGLYLLIVSK